MESLKNMNEALEYIENNLTEKLDYSEVSKIAMCSEYHFNRMFSFLSGVNLSEYVRRRKLTLAALELKNKDVKVLDVALKYGYNSTDSFSRAFSSLHGVLPSEVKKDDVQIKAYPKMTFQLTIKGVDPMNFRIINKEPFKIVGFKKRVNIVFNGVNPEISEMYKVLTPEIIMYLKSISNIEPKGMISASTNFSDGRMNEQGQLDHYIGVATTEENIADYEVLEVAEHTWTVFESVGPFPETLQNIWGRIYSEWFPTSDYEAVNAPEIVWHESPDTTNPNYRSEIWLPVKKK